MKFINKGPSIRVPVGESENRKRVALDTGQTIDIPKEIGEKLDLEFVKVTEGKIGKTKVETKQFENKEYVSFWNELLKIKGIGLNIAKDIVRVFKSRKDLIEAIKSKQHLPFRNDIEKKLRRKYDRR